MRFVYPQSGTNFDLAYRAGQYGNFPLSSFNCWHGGIHLEQRLAPLTAIADGRVIAYRLPSTYHVTEHECPQEYSNGFVLLQHDYKSPQGRELTYYSLYHHVASHQDITQGGQVGTGSLLHSTIPAPAFLAKNIWKTSGRNLPSGVRARSATDLRGSRGKEIVLLPKDTILVRDTRPEALAPWAIEWNKKHTPNSRYYPYSHTDPFTGTVYSDLHVFTGALKVANAAANEYRVISSSESPAYKKNGQNTSVYPDMKPGTLVYSERGGPCTGVITEGTEVFLASPPKAGEPWVELADKGGFIKKSQVAGCAVFRDDISTDTIVGRNDYVKAGETVAYVGKFGMRRDEHRYSSHFEVFTDAAEGDLNDFLNDCSGDGEPSYFQYRYEKGTKLTGRLEAGVTLPKGTPVRVLKREGGDCKVKVGRLRGVLRKYVHMYDVLDGKGRDIKRTAPDGKSYPHYTLCDEEMDYIKRRFNGLPTKDSYVYFHKTVGKGEDRKYLREVYFYPDFFGKTYWIPTDALNDGSGTATHLGRDVTDTYLTGPVCQTDEENTFQKEYRQLGEPSIVTDGKGQDWYYVTAGYLHEGINYHHEGYLSVDDDSIEKRNPFDWTQFGFKTYEAGDQYVYALQDYHQHSETAPFIDYCWKSIDQDGNNVLTPLELQRVQSHPRYADRLGKLIVRHRSEWSYTPDEIAAEAKQFYQLGIDAEEDDERKSELEKRRDEQLALLKEKVNQLMWWGGVQAATYSPGPDSREAEYARKRQAIHGYYFRQADADYDVVANERAKAQRLAELEEYYTRHRTAPAAAHPGVLTVPAYPMTYYVDRESIEKQYERVTDAEFTRTPDGQRMDAELIELEKEYEQGRYARPPRRLPSGESVWHFEGINFVRALRQMYPQDVICVCETRLRAFMSMIRVGEGTVDEGGYSRIVGGSTLADHGKDFSTHPNYRYEFTNKNDETLISTAAGAYQITYTNWLDDNFVNWRNRNGVTDFTPVSQDKYCFYLIKEKRKALGAIQSGDLAQAVDLCRKEWASLPGAGYAQREESMSAVRRHYDDFYKKERRGQSILKAPHGAFDPYGFRCTCGGEIPEGEQTEGILEDMKTLVDTHVPYKQQGDTSLRTTDSDAAMEYLDCSEFVCRYLHALGVTTSVKHVSTAGMVSERTFQRSLGTTDLIQPPGGDQASFVPMPGDIFVWRTGKGGHTGVVYEADANTVTILESIGSGGSSDETFHRNSGGHKQKNCSRTSYYQRTGRALAGHDGWRGYFRPINYPNKL